MDESVSTPSGREANSGTGRPAAADAASELSRARERLAFYESFDALIQENVQRSGELLRRVAAEQEQAERKLREMQARVDQRLAEQRTVLEDIASGLTGLQSNLETLTSRINASLTDLPRPSATPTVPPQTADEQATAPQADGAAGAHGAIALQLAAAPRPTEQRTETVSAPIGASTDSDPIGAAHEQPGTTLGAGEGAATEALDAPGAAPAKPSKLDLIIHGVPNAATALSLQRHLQGLPSVEAVDVREYVSGVLRFQVVATTFGADDLRGWPGGAGLEPITAREHVLELKLPTAEGF